MKSSCMLKSWKKGNTALKLNIESPGPPSVWETPCEGDHANCLEARPHYRDHQMDIVWVNSPVYGINTTVVWLGRTPGLEFVAFKTWSFKHSCLSSIVQQKGSPLVELPDHSNWLQRSLLQFASGLSEWIFLVHTNSGDSVYNAICQDLYYGLACILAGGEQSYGNH